MTSVIIPFEKKIPANKGRCFIKIDTSYLQLLFALLIPFAYILYAHWSMYEKEPVQFRDENSEKIQHIYSALRAAGITKISRVHKEHLLGGVVYLSMSKNNADKIEYSRTFGLKVDYSLLANSGTIEIRVSPRTKNAVTKEELLDVIGEDISELLPKIEEQSKINTMLIVREKSWSN